MAEQRDQKKAGIQTADERRPDRKREAPPQPRPVAPEDAKHDVEDDDRFQATDN